MKNEARELAAALGTNAPRKFVAAICGAAGAADSTGSWVISTAHPAGPRGSTAPPSGAPREVEGRRDRRARRSARSHRSSTWGRLSRLRSRGGAQAPLAPCSGVRIESVACHLHGRAERIGTHRGRRAPLERLPLRRRFPRRGVPARARGSRQAMFRRFAFIRPFTTGTAPEAARYPPSLPRSPRTRERSPACTGPGSIPRDPAKARVAAPKKALGPIHGLGVRFAGAPGNAVLVVGEGVETVLSVLTALPDLHGAAALSASNLQSFTPPPGVETVLIARDNDSAGERAAARLERRCRERGLNTELLVPTSGDFNDDLLALGPAVLAERIAPSLGSTTRTRAADAWYCQAQERQRQRTRPTRIRTRCASEPTLPRTSPPCKESSNGQHPKFPRSRAHLHETSLRSVGRARPRPGLSLRARRDRTARGSTGAPEKSAKRRSAVSGSSPGPAKPSPCVSSCGPPPSSARDHPDQTAPRAAPSPTRRLTPSGDHRP